MCPAMENWINQRRYRMVFFLEPIENYESTEVRIESQETAAKISQEIQDAYAKYGYKLVFVPFKSIEERCKIVEEHIEKT